MNFTNKTIKEIILELGFLAAAIALISVGWGSNILLTILLVGELCIVLTFWHEKRDIAFCATAAIVGPLIEIICIYYGAWEYNNAAFWGIPVWLPIAWAIAGALVKRIAETVIKIIE